MHIIASRSQTAISQFAWLGAYEAEPSLSGLPLRKGLRRPETSDLFVLPLRQSFLKDPRLMPGTTRMLCLLAGWYGRGGPLNTTLGVIARHLGRSVRQVQRYIQDAAEEGYLYYSKRADRMGYVIGLKIGLNVAAIFAPKKTGESGKRGVRRVTSLVGQATTQESATNEKPIYIRGQIGDYERQMMALMDSAGLDYQLRDG